MKSIIGRSEFCAGWWKSMELMQSRYHDENTKEADLIHPEDIEHFKKHNELEDEAEAQAVLDKLPIVEQNIPQKFRRDGA
jgi:hypothetical protein